MSIEFLVSSTQLSHQHGDKICDILADTIVDAALETCRTASVNVQVLLKGHTIVVLGELNSSAPVYIETLVKKAYGELCPESDLPPSNQLPHVLSLVEKKTPKQTQSAVQLPCPLTIYHGYATDETSQMLPLPITLATKILDEIRQQRINKNLPFVNSEAQATVVVKYEKKPDGKISPKTIQSVLLSFYGEKDVSITEAQKMLKETVFDKVLTGPLFTDKTLIQLNLEPHESHPDFQSKNSSSGKRFASDTYGGWVAQTDMVLSGRDLSSKSQRTGICFARWLAKSLVASELCSRCEVDVAFGNSQSEPEYLRVNSFSTSKLGSDKALEDVLLRSFDFRSATVAKDFSDAFVNKKLSFLSSYNHFLAASQSPWEQPKKLSPN